MKISYDVPLVHMCKCVSVDLPSTDVKAIWPKEEFYTLKCHKGSIHLFIFFSWKCHYYIFFLQCWPSVLWNIYIRAFHCANIILVNKFEYILFRNCGAMEMTCVSDCHCCETPSPASLPFPLSHLSQARHCSIYLHTVSLKSKWPSPSPSG